MDAKKTTMLLGLAFLVFLALSYVQNVLFFNILGDVLANQFLAVVMLFTNNVLVISLILLGMTFYVNLVILDFFKREKYAHIVLEHPRTFAIVFTIMILFLSILRGSNLIYGGISIEVLPIILLVSVPIGIVEGYGIYLTIKKTLSREMTMKSLVSIYVIFLMAAIMEVIFINLLIWTATG
ncbi:MAG: hypothetical protein OEZ21_04840 [Candidatus Bathyarchaeota archaeon]|nr:hypothetical protein [Candidatus Bathyarchaeota archaeon]MDH5746267.1 hypothetical protein [Candidatus Bathyarchaeota archaeon]